MRETNLYERLDFSRGHRIIHLGLKTTSRHRDVNKVFRPKRAYRFRQLRDGGLNWRYHSSPEYRGKVRFKCTPSRKISPYKYSLIH